MPCILRVNFKQEKDGAIEVSNVGLGARPIEILMCLAEAAGYRLVFVDEP